MMNYLISNLRGKFFIHTHAYIEVTLYYILFFVWMLNGIRCVCSILFAYAELLTVVVYTFFKEFMIYVGVLFDFFITFN
nr:hypothetical protein Iba_chr05cCG17790 [Ipomoea batatas]GMC98582.1 hypothetical protein Iba_chr05dCG17880 [Ipomoea batatas]